MAGQGFGTGRCDGMMEVYSWGANSYGQLGLGHTQDQLAPRKLKECNFKPKDIVGGGGHTVFISDKGDVYSCGWNNKGQLGLGHQLNVMGLERIVFSLRVCKVACGWNHTLALSECGKLYSWGSNAYGQLGHGSQGCIAMIPTLIEKIKDIEFKDVAAGLRHTLALDEQNSIWSWGTGKRGQLGHGKRINVEENPTKIEAVRGSSIKQIIAGCRHSACLSESGDVFCWGSNQYGQCALESKEDVLTPSKINSAILNNALIIEIRTGWNHLLALAGDGVIFSWGRCDYGQLGIDIVNEYALKSCQERPAQIFIAQDIKQLCCGSEHNIVRTDANKVLTWGWNEHGMCGSGNDVNVRTPSSVISLSDCKTILIGCGAGHSFAVVDRRHN